MRHALGLCWHGAWPFGNSGATSAKLACFPIAGHDPILNRVEPCGSSHAEGGALDSAEMWCKLPGNSSKQLGHFLGK